MGYKIMIYQQISNEGADAYEFLPATFLSPSDAQEFLNNCQVGKGNQGFKTLVFAGRTIAWEPVLGSWDKRPPLVVPVQELKFPTH